MPELWSGEIFVEYATINLMDQSALDHPDQLPEKAPDWPPGEYVRAGPGWLSFLSATSDHYAHASLTADGPTPDADAGSYVWTGSIDCRAGVVEFWQVTLGPASDEIRLPGGPGKYRCTVLCSGRDELIRAATDSDDFPSGVEQWNVFLEKDTTE